MFSSLWKTRGSNQNMNHPQQQRLRTKCALVLMEEPGQRFGWAKKVCVSARCFYVRVCHWRAAAAHARAMLSWKTKSKLPFFPAGSSASKICIFTNIYIYDNLNTHKNLAVLVTLIDQDLRCLQVLAWDIFCGIQQVSSHLARSDEAWSDEKMQGLSTSSTAMGPPKLLHVDLSGLKPHLLTYYYTGRGPCCRVVQYCLDTVSLLFALQLWTIFPKNVMAWHHTGRWVHDVPSNLG